MRMSEQAGAPLLAVALAVLVAACGGGSSSAHQHSSTSSTVSRSVAAVTTTSSSSPTTTTTTSSSTAPTTTTTTTTTTPSTTTTSSTTTTPSSTTTATTTTTQTTRTESKPAFVQTTPSGGADRALTAAIAVLARHGYMPLALDSYGPADTLHVLIGIAQSGGAATQRAFFFNEGTYLGTDASTPSAQVEVVSHSDSEVTLAYTVVHAGHSGVRRVRFALDMGQLSALDPLPSVAARR